MEWEHLPTPDLTGRTVVMTGASDGLGREAALRLALWGADLVLAVRDRRKGEVVAARIVRETGRPGAVRLTRLDLAELASVRDGAEEIARTVGPGGIDLLIHVAGLVTARRRESADGLELMTAERGAGPVLFAATQPLPPGSYIGPDGRGSLQGRPTFLRRSEVTLDRELAAEVTAWARAEVTAGPR